CGGCCTSETCRQYNDPLRRGKRLGRHYTRLGMKPCSQIKKRHTFTPRKKSKIGRVTEVGLEFSLRFPIRTGFQRALRNRHAASPRDARSRRVASSAAGNKLSSRM